MLQIASLVEIPKWTILCIGPQGTSTCHQIAQQPKVTLLHHLRLPLLPYSISCEMHSLNIRSSINLLMCQSLLLHRLTGETAKR